MLKTNWTLQDAKNKFSQLVNEALTQVPQYVMRRGVDAVVVLSVRDYEKLTSQKQSFAYFLLSCPKLADDEHFLLAAKGRNFYLTLRSYAVTKSLVGPVNTI
jgi:prevent-host-death family protein